MRQHLRVLTVIESNISVVSVENLRLENKIGLFDVAHHCLILADPAAKVADTDLAAARWQRGELILDGESAIERIADPGRPIKPALVPTKSLPTRKLGSAEGHAAFMHAIAHIEFNAINLAWDAVYRFRDMPKGFYDDWVRIAQEEASHFNMVSDYLQQLGYEYGSFDAHNNLWDMAVATDDDVLRRMTLVPRVLEARGLDVTPGMIERLRHQGFDQAVAILEVIYREEIGHVESGSRWFNYLCEQRQLDPQRQFEDLINAHAKNRVRKPINEAARADAGFSQDEINYLYSLL
jgi:uncharacterized ferritin-like protein (DUF455 family)